MLVSQHPATETMMSAVDSKFDSSNAPPAKPNRYHELDFLRGWMMMLGLVLHSAVAYMQTPLNELWGYKDAHTHFGFDLLVGFVHTFRMPVFWVLAGFFACLLYEQRGVRGMVRNRARRVLYPLVVAWLVVFPLTIAGFAFAQLGGTAEAAREAVAYVTSGEVLQQLQWLHLWFLLDLLLYYGLALLVCRLIRVVPEASRARLLDKFARLVERWYAPLPFALITALTLAPMESGMLETPGTFYRPVPTLIANAVFFAFGWLLYWRRASLSKFVAYAWRWTLLACALFPVHGLALMRLAEGPNGLAHTISITSLATIIWLFIFGLTGLFVRYLARPSPLGRYVADASYWFYLIHLPLVAWGCGLLANRPWPVGLKYLVLLSGVVGISWVTYDIVVRPTLIGVFLNGRRYPRGLPSKPG